MSESVIGSLGAVGIGGIQAGGMARASCPKTRPPQPESDEEGGYVTSLVYSSDSDGGDGGGNGNGGEPTPRRRDRCCSRRARWLCCESLRDMALVLILGYWAIDNWACRHRLLWYDYNLIYRARWFGF